ncbi:MAG: phosphosulfolactate synthase, partial [Gemmatimonadaceae bacterium]
MTPTTTAARKTDIAPARAFDFLYANQRSAKPRRVGLTEIRGPYYSPMGPRYLTDLLDTMGAYVDSLKFAGGSFTLMPRPQLKELINLCHRAGVLVSTGGFIERVLTQCPEAVAHYIRDCRDVFFDIIEISSGFITLPA